MGLWDRITGSFDKRSTEIVGPQGEMLNKNEYKGLWASAIGANSAAASELNKIKPHADEATNLSAVAARSIDIIVDTLSALDLQVTTSTGEPVDDHFLEQLFNHTPNPSESARLFKKSMWYRIYNQGEAIIVLDRGPSRVDTPKTAHLHYGKTRVRLSKPTPQAPQGDIIAFEIEVDKKWYVLSPSEVLWLREPQPGNPWKSRAPMEAALESIGLSRAAKGWQAGQLLNGANPNGIVYLGDPENDDAYFLAREEVEAALTGPSSAGRIATFAGPVKPEYIKVGFNAQEVAYLDTLKVSDEQIVQALGVPRDLVFGGSTYENQEQALKVLWEHTLLPKLAIIASEINRQILSDTDLFATFDTSSVTALQQNLDAIASRITTIIDKDIITINEARAALGYDPLTDGGDVTLSAYKVSLGLPVPGVNAALPEARTIEVDDSKKAFRNIVETPAKRVYDVPQYIQDNAARGLRYYEEGLAGDGVTDQTVAEAREMAGGFVSEDKIKRIGPWIARHLVDLDASKNNDPEDAEYPGPGLVAHLLWGSGPDKTTANRVRRWAEREAAKLEDAEDRKYTRGLEEDDVERKLDSLEAQAIRVVRRMAEAMRRDAEKRLQRVGVRETTFPADANLVFNAAAWTERAYEYLLPVIARALEEGFEATANALGVTLNFDEYITVSSDARTKVLVDQVNTTTAKVLQDRLTAAAIADRISVDEYKKALKSTFDDLTSWRAETIARTEMIGSFNGASRQAAQDSGVVLAREWRATKGMRTRPSHLALDAVRTVGMTDPYPNGLLYPGDPSGAAKETVNCRCTELFITEYSPEKYDSEEGN
jgi:HK97 family phage portal protein